MYITVVKKIISSKILRAFLFLIGFFFAWKLVYDDRYSARGEIYYCFICFSAMMILICVSAWLDRKDGFILNRAAKIDYTLLMMVTIGIFVTGANLLRGYFYEPYVTMPYSGTPLESLVRIPKINVLLISLVAYTFAYLLIVVLVRHIRDKSLVKRMYLVRFLKLYPPNTAAGFGVLIMAAILIGFMLFMLRNANPTAFIFGDFVCISVLLYLCDYMTKLSDLHEKSNEEKLKSERLKIELITNVSHDIRTPLTSIINYVDLIKRLDIDNATLAEYVAVLDKKSARLKILINDLMDASKASAGDIKVNLTVFDLAELVGQVAGEFDDDISAAGLIPVFKPPTEPVLITADNTLLFRIAENIFSNAVKYAMKGTRVYCDIRVDKNETVFSLKNVSREELNISPDELTERFVRGDSSRTNEGNGLGLYIAKSFAELMGARFDVIINGDLFEVVMRFRGGNGG